MSNGTVLTVTEPAPVGAPRIIRTPGVGGYTARLIADHIDQAIGSVVANALSVWPAGGWLFQPINTPKASTVTLETDGGHKHFRSPGSSSTGGRLLGPHIAPRPQTFAAVVRAAAGVTTVVGASGQLVGRVSGGTWQGGGGASVAATTTNNNNGWTFVLIAQAADNTYLLRADAVESAQVAGVAAPTSFGGAYFGSPTAGHVVEIRELIHWPLFLDATQRAAVHAYMRSRYADLP